MANLFYKSKPPASVVRPVGVKAKVYSKHRKSGVVGLVRDSYGKKSDWYALCKEVKIRDRYKCVFCKKPEKPKEGVYHHVHHLVSLSKGGTTTRSNLATTCESCHGKRPGHGHLNHKHS